MSVYIVLFIQLLLALCFLFLSIALFTGAPFVPTSRKTAKKMVEMADIKRTDIVYDLGSGDGRLLLLAAKQLPKKIVGIEINLFLVLLTKLISLFSPQKSLINCKWGNFWGTPLYDADIVFVYLLPWKMDALKQKLFKELKPGAKVISNSFQFVGWKQIQYDKKNSVYVYQR